MILDDYLKMSEAQAVTSSAASTSYIDTLAAGDSYEGAWLYILVDTTTDSAGDAAVITFSLQTDDNSSFSSATTLVSSGEIVQATAVAGYVYKVRIPAGAERYLRVYYSIATADLSAGKFDAYIVKDVQTNQN